MKSPILIGIVAVALAGSPVAEAGFLGPGMLGNPNQLSSISDAVVTGLGLFLDHRPYEPATPMGKGGLDVSIEATLAQMPTVLVNQLGASMASALPLPKINLRKGLTDFADIGVSGIFFEGYYVIGGDLKICFLQQDEGPTWAFRMIYNTSFFSMDGGTPAPLTTTVNLNINTLTPELLVSRRLDFADPYIGVGYQYAYGAITAIATVPGFPTQTQTSNGYGGGFLAFMGVSLRVPMLGLRLTPEMAYSAAGANSLGVKLGLNF